jgi:hypothetical protein
MLLVNMLEAVENYEALKQRVETYLNKIQRTKRSDENIAWLQNSNKIGLGYNPIFGSPICFTGDCESDGFRRPIFKLTFTSPEQGSCTDQLIPDHVDLDCLPSSVSSAVSQEINTLDDLKQSTSNGIDINTGLSLFGASFSYDYSEQTTRMVESIVKQSMTMFFTTATVTYAKLSLFEPTAQLSDEFIYVITNMPCCNVSDQNIKDYVFKYIFDYFGYTYVTELVLGGRTQDLITMKSSDVTQLESESISTKNEAKVSFYVTFDTAISSTMDKSNQQEFMNKVQNDQSMKLGGDPSTTSLSDWSKTVPDNPVVTKFTVDFLNELITLARFPNDTQIAAKASILNSLLINYINLPLFCWNNCSGNGTCVPTLYFNIGTCNCNQGYTGTDCSELLTPAPNGTICGWALNGGPGCTGIVNMEVISCDGLNPQLSCPLGYGQAGIPLGWRLEYFTCYKLQTDSNPGKNGTLCGAPFSKCGGMMPARDGCPLGYNYSQPYALCHKTNPGQQDASGTWCGYGSIVNCTI